MNFEHSSIWHSTDLDYSQTYPELDKSHDADIIIIGAGISGLTAAYLLSGSGKKILLIEAGQIASGTSGHSTGNLYTLVDHHLSKLIDKWGLEKARMVVQSREQAIKLIESLVHKYDIDCQFQRVKFTYFSEEENHESLQFIEEEAKAALNLGLHYKKQTKINALPFVTKLAMEFPNQAQFHPLKYLRKIASVLPPNVEIFENSPALEIDCKNKLVKTSKGQAKGKILIVATNVPKGIWPVQFKLHPIREYGIAAELKEGAFPGIYWSMARDKMSVRSITVKDRCYVLAIGKKYKTGQDKQSLKELKEMSNYLSKRFIVTDERQWWSAQTYQSADMLPYIGELDKDCYSLTGFSTDGLVYGTLGAMIIADQISRKENSFSELYSFERHSFLKSAKTVMKESMDNLCQYAKDIPGLKTINPENLSTGEGGIVEKNGEKIAVFRDENNQLHCVSAVCTHMKCIVSFNSNEKTWDCPCHASRFDLQGRVLEGPALTDLKEMSL